MKIIAPIYGTKLFGREKENIECLKALNELGFEVLVWGSQREPEGGDVGRKLKKLRFLQGMLPFGSHFAFNYFLKLKGYWHRQIYRIYSCSRTMLVEERRKKPQLIFIGGTMEYLYLFPWLHLTARKIIFRNGDGPIWQSSFHSLVYKMMLRRADYVIPVSPFIQRECIKLYPKCAKRIHVIPNCVPDDKSELQQNKSEDLEQLHLVYLGQITEQKGLPILLDALKLVKDLPITCTIVGGSEHTLQLENKLKFFSKKEGLKTRWVGYSSEPFEHLCQADAHVAPSVYEEPFGLVAIEAKKVGIPSIIFPSGGLKDLIRTNVDGLVTRNKSATDLANAFRQMLELKKTGRILDMGAAAKRDYQKNYTFDSFKIKWAEFIMPEINNL